MCKHLLYPLTDPLVPDLKSWKLVIPEEQRVKVIETAHLEPQAEHLGIEKTRSRITLGYYWLGTYHEIAKLVRP